MKIDIITLFPQMFKGPFSESIIKRAIRKDLISINTHDLRKWTTDKYRTVDDKPYGGGAGMVMKVDVIDRALQDIKSKNKKSKTILLSARGKLFNQKKAQSLSQISNLILICGHYEGVDERVLNLVDEEISIGDYILTGGELPAMVIIDSIVRLIPGVLGKNESLKEESFTHISRLKAEGRSHCLLEYPQYTRPKEYTPQSIREKKKMRAPQILLTGNHQKITEWRLKKAIEKTKKTRPGLLK
ncbi:MAG: tRNA (guanosine(37)-N1)-methyltransferase TrmD [Candidatus Berkelbacteria bacterium]|nr:tRNA (guanosine(37)-N1)-methyltransferase TrmD [Candidatus Berkelbacteria bacterium]